MTKNSGNFRILILGGSGFFSGTLARRALSQGYDVWTITRGQRLVPEGVTSLIADRNDASVFQSVVKNADIVWDLVVDCIAFKPEDVKQDIALFEEISRHFIMISTDFVYDPEHRQTPQREETEHYSKTGYGYQKRLSELELINYDGTMPWTILRPTHIYGPGSELGCLPEHSRDTNLINTIRVGESLRLVGGGYLLQQPILAKDLADLCLSIQGNEKTNRQILNAAGPDIIPSRDYYQIIAEILGVDLKIEEIPILAYRAEHPESSNFLSHRFYDMGKLQSCGVQPPITPIAEGLREHVGSLL
jgi:nucleoside-diphosphate-sugar epimerase